ncbi:MAG: NADH-ubiquinone oxidoreductase subunit NDUFA12 family protein [Tepidamorphaceae bacterium]
MGTLSYMAVAILPARGDEFGNKYYRNPNAAAAAASAAGSFIPALPKRSTVPAIWHGWLHHTLDVPPTEDGYKVLRVERPHL